LYFPELSSVACEIMILMFLHTNRILLLSVISCSFSWNLSWYSHHMLSSPSNITL
jgi:hypothetical protein